MSRERKKVTVHHNFFDKILAKSGKKSRWAFFHESGIYNLERTGSEALLYRYILPEARNLR
jgi:hypothetical protein